MNIKNDVSKISINKLIQNTVPLHFNKISTFTIDLHEL